MKSEYNAGVMLCFVQGFEGQGQQTAAKDKDKDKEANNNATQKKRPPLKKLLVQLAADAEKGRDEARDIVGELLDSKTPEVRFSKRIPEVKRSFSDRFIPIGDPAWKKNNKTPTLIRKTRSSGNFASLPHSGSGLGPARSAPNTPLQDPPGNQPPAHPNQHPAPIQASPHRHHSGHKHERSGLKQLSQSAPSVSANGAANATSAAAAETAAAAAVRKPPSQPSKARQKKFLRHFPQVSPDERVLNYYSCALVGDILLQGHLYITKNYFAFYSNVFGYVTKLLIPTASVLRVSKEKMARIIPNAVGVVTDDERHVFGSLLSRDSTYRLMLQVWKEAAIMHRVVPPEGKELRVSEAELDASEYSMDEDSSSGAEGHAGAIIRAPGEASAKGDGAIAGSQVTTGDTRRRKTLPVEAVLLRKSSSVRKTSHTNSSGGALGRIFAAGAAALLALLAVMAGVLIWRLLNHPSITATALEDRLQTMTREDMYTEILRWQNQLHRKSANEVNGFLETNLDQIAKVRQSLEALSAIMVTDRQDKIGHHEELSSPTDQADQKTGLDNFKS